MLQRRRVNRWKTIFSCSLLLSVCSVQQAHAQVTYSYEDDFSTDKAVGDSYLHSPLVDALPPLFLDGLLMYSYETPDNRVLGFYKGFEEGADGFLSYRFPIGGGNIGSTAGHLEFDLGSVFGYFGDMDVSVSFDPGPGGFAITIPSPGHYEYELTLPQVPGGVYVRFNGRTVGLDNLSLSFGAPNAACDATWGRIKALFR